MKEEAVKWVEQAKADLRTAENSMKSKDFYASVFWSQQSIEKSLKAQIIRDSDVLLKLHDLIVLGRKAKLPEELIKKIKLMGGIYTESRYGISEEIPAKKFKERDSLTFLEIAKEVLRWVEKKI